MFWVKKLVAASAVAALLGGGLMLGYASDPAPGAPTRAPLAAQPDDPAADAKRIAEKIAALKKQQAELEHALKAAEAQKLAVLKRAELLAARAAAEVQKNAPELKVVVNGDEQAVWEHRYRIEERTPDGPVVYGTSTPAGLTKLLARAHTDPTGPKSLTVVADKDVAQEQVTKVLTACATAGFKKATVTLAEGPSAPDRQTAAWLAEKLRVPPKPEAKWTLKLGELDLGEYLPKPAEGVIRKW